MAVYQRILVTTDLSPVSRLVVMQAKAFAAAMGGDLFLLHVLEPSPLSYGGEFSLPIDPDLEASIERQAAILLQKQALLVGVEPEAQYLRTGSIKHEVAECARDCKADLIILGRHGHHGIADLLGSTANAIVHVAPCDVLTVSVQEEV